MNEPEAYPLTNAQWLIWLGVQQHPDSALYNTVATIRIGDAIEASRFAAAVVRVLSESDALRSTFREVGGRPHRFVRPVTALANEIDIADFSQDSEPEASFREWLSERRRRVLDVGQQVYDTALIKLGDRDYVWYLNQHHLVADAWSTRIVYERVAAHYSSGVPDPAVLPTFEQYAESIVASSATKHHAAAVAHWRQREEDAFAAEPLAFYGRSESRQTTRCERISIEIGGERAGQLAKLARDDSFRAINHDVAQFQLYSTALFALLHRASGLADISLGAPALNRGNAKERNTIGLLMEIFALRMTVAADDSLRTLYRKVAVETMQFFRHARPSSSSVELLRSFNVLLNYVRGAFPDFGGAPVEVDFQNVGEFESHMALRLQIRDLRGDGQSILDFDFNAGIFPEALRRSFVDQYLRLIDALITETDRPISDLDLLGDEQRRYLLRDLNNTSRANAQTEPLHRLFEARARENSDLPAVIDPAQAITYGDLDRLANGLAHQLRQQAVRRGDIVVVVVDRSANFIAATLAALKTGAVYVPIDTSLPARRQRQLVELGQPTAIIVSRSGDAARLNLETDTVVIGIDEIEAIASNDVEPMDDEVDLDCAAYALFTSGTTGVPKGVLCSHRGVVNLLCDIEERKPLAAGARSAFWTSVGFDVSVYEIFSALAFGGTLYVVPESVRADADRLYAWVRDNDIQSAYLPPFVLPGFRRLSRSKPGCLPLQRLLVGVEPIPLALLVELSESNPGLQIINGYGPTEATICATLYSVEASESADGRTPIGRPVRNNRLYVLDQKRRPVPFGAPGELYIGGDGLALGYLKLPEMTAARFVDDPFDPSGRQRLYRTGDLVRYLPDGNLEFIERVDDQLKIRGHRVEPAEVERALMQFQHVDRALVVAIDTEDGEKALVAYIVSTESLDLTPADWFERLQPVLPRYMVPSVFICLDELPQTASGKVDRDALPRPVLSAAPERAAFIAPRDALEETIANLWAEVLNCGTVGVATHFIDLGGESIQAMQIAARAHEAGIELSARDVFESATVAALADAVRSRTTSVKDASANVDKRVSSLQDAASKAGLSEQEFHNLLAEFGDDDASL